MSSSIRLTKIAKEKEESRNIVMKIIDFGVKDDQIYNIILGLSMNLEDNNAMQEISNIIKKYITKINNDEEPDNNKSNKKSKIIIN
jgi:hypothetical protein